MSIEALFPENGSFHKKSQFPAIYKEKLERVVQGCIKWTGSLMSIFVHTLLFASVFSLYLRGVPVDQILLILTTVVSLEAIYLSLFIQYTVNKQTEEHKELKGKVHHLHEHMEEQKRKIGL